MSEDPNTDPQTPPEPDPEAGADIDTPPENGGTPEGQQPDDRVAEANREAAKWRRQLREEQAKTEVLTARIDGQDRREIEARAAGLLTDPSDLWSIATLDDLRDDDGALDDEKYGALMQRIVDEKQHWLKSPGLDLHQGTRETATEPPSFGAAVKKTLGG